MNHKVILIGTQGFGEQWREATAINGLEVVAVVDKYEEARMYGKQIYQLKDEQVFSNETDEWKNVAADIVIDASPPKDRIKRVNSALETGKNIILAKPYAYNLEELIEVTQLKEKFEKGVYLATQKRYFPVYYKIKRLMETGKLGNFVYGDISLDCDGTYWKSGAYWRKKMPYPSLIDAGIHHFDLIYWWTGLDARKIIARSWNPTGSKFDNDSDFWCNVKYYNGANVNIVARWSHKYGKVVNYFSGIRLEFENGLLQVIDGKLFLNNMYIPVEHDGEEYMDTAFLNRFLLRDAIDSIDNVHDNYKISIENSIETHKLVIGAVASIKNNKVIELDDLLDNLNNYKIDKLTMDKDFENVFERDVKK